MNHVERFNRLMAFEPVDRLPVVEWAGWWTQTLDRWYTEGLPDVGDAAAIREHLGLDPWRQHWQSPRAATCPGPAHHGAGLLGDEAGYERLLPYLYPEPDFNRAPFTEWAQACRRGEMVVWLTLEGFFWYPRTLFGIERHLLAFYDHPELMHRMNADLTAYNRRVVEAFTAVCPVQFMTFAEDLSYNHGPMLSKRLFDAFLAPYYRELIPVLNQHGILPLIDSDGDVEPLIPWFEAVGIEGILPLERMAGVDVNRIRREHPRWRMIGAFDKTVMHLGEAALRIEFERLLPVMRSGGFIPGCDHQTPPGVSLEDYRLYLRLLNEYARRAADGHAAGVR